MSDILEALVIKYIKYFIYILKKIKNTTQAATVDLELMRFANWLDDGRRQKNTVISKMSNRKRVRNGPVLISGIPPTPIYFEPHKSIIQWL